MNKLFIGLIGIVIGLTPSVASTDNAQTATSSVTQRTDVGVTVYNNDLALVRDVRQMHLPTGEILLTFEDVATEIRPETVSMRAIGAPASLVIYEQNYEYDLITPQKLMEKYLGRNVRLLNRDNQYQFHEVDAVLLSLNGGPVYQIGNDIYLGHPGTVVLPELPENLVARPSLVWTLGNSRSEQDVEITYLTRGISWKADYVINIPRSDDVMSLTGWVTLNNQSGIAYDNAELKLVAGDVNIVQDKEMTMDGFGGGFMAYDGDFDMPVQEAFADYHLYTVPRRTSIAQNQSKQIMLLHASDIAFTRRYAYRNYAAQPLQQTSPLKVDSFLEFDNKDTNQLGIPLPAGTMRVYQEDSQATLQFSGEDTIEHTPRNEPVKLNTGKAFDVTLELIWTDYEVISSTVHEYAVKVTVRNEKDEDVTVDYYDTFHTQWNILESSQEFTQEDAFTVLFPVEVSAGDSATVTYRVRIG